MKYLMVLFSLFSLSAFAAAPVDIVYKTENGINFKRKRCYFSHNQEAERIEVGFYEWIEDSSGNVIGKQAKKKYGLTGSYYYELSLAASGATTIGDYLDAAIDARLGAYTIDIQAGIDAGRPAKNTEMLAAGWAP